MARKKDSERIAEWDRRIKSANKVRDRWASTYRVDELWNYYLGHQWKDREYEGNYVINLVFSTVETQLPSQLFYNPRTVVKARPAKADDATQGPSMAAMRAQLQEDTLNTFIGDPKLCFKEECSLGLLESYFSFGIIETGYTADFSDNPNAGKPLLQENSQEPLQDAKGDPVLQASIILNNEWLYFKRIPSHTFRVGINAKPKLEQNDWCGYYEYHWPADLKRNKRYKNTTNLPEAGKLHGDYSGDMPDTEDDTARYDGMVKVWKIWDIRAGMRLDFAENGKKFLLEEPLERWPDGTPFVPFEPLLKYPRLNEFYPLPPVFNWLSPQDELNEARNMQKVYRRKLVPKYRANANVDQAELDKFMEPVVQVIRTNRPEDLTPIDVPSSDAAVIRAIPPSKDDFLEVSGTSSEQRGVSEADTATQANIIELRGRIRETKAKEQVADWLARISRKALFLIRNRMALPFWIKRNVDMAGPLAPLEAAQVAEVWEQIGSDQLGDLSSDISVDVESLSPVLEASERQDWVTVLQLIAADPTIVLNDTLARKTLGMYGIRSEKDIAGLKQWAQMRLLMQGMQAQQQAAGKGGESGGGAAPGPTPDNGDIQGQLDQQMPSQQVI